MKKKIIAVLLSSMMFASSLSCAVMAKDSLGEAVVLDAGESEEVQETQDIDADADEDEFFDVEEEAETEEETEDVVSDTEEEESLFTDGTMQVSEDGKVTLNGTEFDITKTYLVPLTLKNANNLEQDSAAVACPGKFGKLTFDAEGTPTISTNLRSVTVGTLTDYAYNFKVYQNGGKSGETVDAAIVSSQTVAKADGSGTHEVPETISFVIPPAARVQNGVYLSMYVDAMGYAPDAYLQMDFANAKEVGDASLNFTTEVTTAKVEQFGEYNVTAQVTVKEGRITDVVLAGNSFGGSHASDNEMYLSKAINGTSSIQGMKDRLVGLYMNDAQKLNDLDTVTGATYSSNAIKTATMNALGVKIEQEVIPDAPTKALEAGLYSVTIKDRTAVVDHGLVGEEKKVTAYLRVDESGKMWLSYKMISGTTGEPLWVLGYNGYYKNNDAGSLTMDGVTYSTAATTAPTIGDCTVVTDITVPLDGLRQTYVNNVYLYVDAMKNLDGEVSGVLFDKGKFNIDSTITLYWDTLTNLSEDTAGQTLATLSDGTYKISGEMVKPNLVDKSMSNEAINHNIKLTVKNGVITVNMNFNGLTVSELKGYLKDLYYYETGYTVNGNGNPSGTLTPVTVNSLQKWSDGTIFGDDFGTNYPNEISFPLVQEALSGSNYIPLQVFVPIMDAISAGSGTQQVYLKLDYSTLKKTTDSDKDFAEQETLQKEGTKSQSITGVKSSISKKFSDKAFSLGAKAKTKLSYKSGNTKVAAVDSKGKVTIKGVGTAKITISAASDSTYKAVSKTVTIKVTKGTPTIKASAVSKTLKYASVKKKNQTFSLGASVNSKGKLTYTKSSGDSKITVDKKTGKITVKKGLKKGTYKVKVKAAAAAKGNYNSGSKTFTVTIKVK